MDKMDNFKAKEEEQEAGRNEEIESQAEAVDVDYSTTVPPWSEHLTLRGFVASFLIGTMYCVIAMKLTLATGIVPTLNISAALLAFVFLRTWTELLRKAGVITSAFTAQENTVVQTCAVACYSICTGGGFGTYLLGLNKKTYEMAGVDTEGNPPGSYKEPGIGWMIGFVSVISFTGLLALVPLRKIMIIDYKLVYPSGTATAVIINSFHTPKGDKLARMQVRKFVKYFVVSFLWSFFQWFFSGGVNCGFAQFPTFGLAAWRQTFFFDFSLIYVGAGMICSHLVNASLLLGAVVSWGITWPLLRNLKGQWYPANLPESSMRSLQGYKVFLSIALILGDGIYIFLKIMLSTAKSLNAQMRNRIDPGTIPTSQVIEDPKERQRNELFINGSIPTWLACSGYAAFAVLAVITIPFIFPQLNWYYVVVTYVLAPAISFSNAYGSGLTDMNMAYNYGKVVLFVLAAWAGKENGVVAGLVGSGLIKSAASIAADLMHDFKTGHLTLTSPRSMLVSQAVGMAMGCVVAPLIFFMFYTAFEVGNPDGAFKAPYALIYRNMAILGVEGFSVLPEHCLQLCYGFFGFAILANVVRDFVPAKYGKWIPLPMVMAIPFIISASFAIDMSLGSVIVLAWQMLDGKNAGNLVPAVASGLICGDGLWTLPSSILALAKVNPPICMKFFSA